MFNIVAIKSKNASKMHIELIVKLSVKIRTGKDELKKGLARGLRGAVDKFPQTGSLESKASSFPPHRTFTPEFQ